MPSPLLPFELIIAIVGLAARQDGQTAVALTLVSNEIQVIADRILFCDIYFRNHQAQQTRDMLEIMFSPFCSPRLLRAGAFVSSFRVQYQADDALNSKTLENVLRYCTNLQTFVPRSLLEPCYAIVPASSLNTLGITHDWDASVWKIKGSHQVPLFRGITHVIVETVGMGMSIFKTSNLTHLFLQVYRRSAPPWTIHPLPPRLKLCLVYFKVETRKEDEMYDAIVSESSWADIQHHGRVDRRFVFVVPYSHATWPGSKTCGGFLVAPDWDVLDPLSETSRTTFYNWFKEDAWIEGENIVKQRVEW
ncbi:hypothetical protein DL96DRAFT_519856 [Flagelloscypha sp. PMI_526]|nr:hypothetical protein DL96DRAFT_519856 [Flagelloscypha sp. PMI_526]